MTEKLEFDKCSLHMNHKYERYLHTFYSRSYGDGFIKNK